MNTQRITDLPTLISECFLHGSVETTLENLIAPRLEDRGVLRLTAVQDVIADLERHGLEIAPPLSEEGGLTTTRLIKPKHILSSDKVSEEIGSAESYNLEFKSSFYFDHKRSKSDGSASLADLMSDAVCHSSLKTVAGFLNHEGGVLYIGVDDNHHVVGIYDDCRLYGKNNVDVDCWELRFRDKIRADFKDGRMVNSYVHIDFPSVDGKVIARIEVKRRKSVSFLKKGGEYMLYRRQGNQTIQIRIDEFEEFLKERGQAGR